MVVFTEADGTQALYVVGASAREYIPGLPPPRILRTTDGVTFTPIPQDPGTTLGSLNAVTFRAKAIYNNRLYVSASPSMTGDGYVLEASTPALGNNSFRQVTNSSLLVYELNVFNGFLYIGAGATPREDRMSLYVDRAQGFLGTARPKVPALTWLSDADLDVFAEAYRKSGFRGGLNWYRNIDRSWELLAPFAGARVTVPALYVAGDHDLVVRFPGMDQLIPNLSRFVPNLRQTIMLPGCGHWTQQERPAEVNAAMLEFLKSL